MYTRWYLGGTSEKGESKDYGIFISQGIFIFIKDKLEDGIPNERILEKLMKNYNLDEQTAQKYISELQDQLAQQK